VLTQLLYRRSLRLFGTLTAALAVLRALLKVLFIDTQTGFYFGGRPLVLLFDALLAVAAAGIVLTAWREPDDGRGQLRGGRWLELTAGAMGAAVLVSSALSFGEALRIDPGVAVINALPRWILLLEHALGLLSGVVLFYLAFSCLSGACRSGFQGMLLLILVLWQTLSLVQRFISFRQVNTASDQLLETLFMVSATLFLLSHARCVARFGAGRKSCLLRALLTGLFGVVLCAGQLAAVAVLGSGIAGPSGMRMAVIAATSLYALSFAWALARGGRPSGE
jgi:hypothetical protein